MLSYMPQETPPHKDSQQSYESLRKVLGAEFENPRIQLLPGHQEEAEAANLGIPKGGVTVSEIAHMSTTLPKYEEQHEQLVGLLQQELRNRDPENDAGRSIYMLYGEMILPQAIEEMNSRPEETIQLLQEFREQMALPAIRTCLAIKLLSDGPMSYLSSDLPKNIDLMQNLELLAQQVLAADKLIEELQQRAQQHSMPAISELARQQARYMLDGILGSDKPLAQEYEVALGGNPALTEYVVSTAQRAAQVSGVQNTVAILNELMKQPLTGFAAVRKALASITDEEQRHRVMERLDTGPMPAIKPLGGGLVRDPRVFGDGREDDVADQDTTVLHRDQLPHQGNSEE